MSNKTQLQTNNLALDGYITRINAAKNTAASLPSAGSGGGNVQMCNGTINVDSPNMDDFTVYSVNSSLQTVATAIDAMGGSFQAAKGTIIAVTPWTSLSTCSGCTKICTSLNGGVYIVDEDYFTIVYGG